MHHSKGFVVLLVGMVSPASLGSCQRNAQQSAETQSSDSSTQVPAFDHGQPSSYAVTITSQSEVGDRQTIHLDVSGKLEVFAVGRTSSRVELSLRLPDAKVGTRTAQGPENIDELARELMRPFFATLDAGRLSELRLSSSMSAAAANVQRTLAAALQFGAAPSSIASWKTFEWDATGKYDVEYARVPGTLRFKKTKTAYQSLVAGKTKLPASVQGGPKTLNFTVTVKSFDGSIELREDGTLASVRYDERLAAQLFEASSLSSQTTLELTRLPMAPSGPAPKEQDHATELARVVRDDAYTAASPVDLDAQRVSGWTFERLVAELETAEREWSLPDNKALGAVQSETDAKARQRAEQLSRRFLALEAIFRKQPATVPLAVAKVRSGSPAAGVLLNGLGSSNAPGSQDGLLEILRDKKMSEELRQAAATSLIRATDPSDKTVAALTQLTSDPVVGVHAVYGLGSFARRLRDAGRAEQSDRISQGLVALLGQARESAGKIDVLRGIANSGYVGALPAVRPYLTSVDALLRSAAVEALRLMRSDEVNKLIAERMEDERASVRNAALGTARIRPPSVELVTAVQKVATAGSDGYGRMKAVRLLGNWLPQQSGLRDTLARVAQEDSEPRIREAAQKLIGG